MTDMGKQPTEQQVTSPETLWQWRRHGEGQVEQLAPPPPPNLRSDTP